MDFTVSPRINNNPLPPQPIVNNYQSINRKIISYLELILKGTQLYTKQKQKLNKLSYSYTQILTKIQDLLKQVNDTSSTNNVVKSLTVSGDAIKNIVYYIEHLSAGEQDRPMKLFSDYQEINKLLGKNDY